MNPEQMIHNRIALTLGDMLIRKISLEAEVEILRQKIADNEKSDNVKPPRVGK